MNFVLRLKDWQLFILLMATPLLVAIILSGVIEVRFVERIFWLVNYTLQFTWLCLTAIGLQRKVAVHLRENRISLNILIISLCILTVILTVGVLLLGNGLYFVLLIILAGFGIIYLIYLTTKSLRMVELQREVVFGDFSREFFIFLFLPPLGLWYIQPRINAVAKLDSIS
ncbi:MAG: hypothetical protein U0U09_15435 [Cyclobacteriaceae bacterium]